MVERHEANEEQRLAVAELRDSVNVEVLPAEDGLHLGVQLGVHGGAAGARDEARRVDCPLHRDFKAPARSEGYWKGTCWAWQAMLLHSRLFELNEKALHEVAWTGTAGHVSVNLQVWQTWTVIDDSTRASEWQGCVGRWPSPCASW